MRSIAEWIVRTTPDVDQPKKINGPVAVAVFVVVLAAGVTGGASWMASVAGHSNAHAATQIAENGVFE